MSVEEMNPGDQGKGRGAPPGYPVVDALDARDDLDLGTARSVSETGDVRFAQWVEPEIEVLLRVAHSLTGSWADAEDVVQDTLIRAYRAIDGFDGRHPRAWLLTILRRTHLNSLRRTRPDLVEDASLERRRPAFGRASVVSPEDVLDERLLDGDIEVALQALDPRFRTVVLLVDVNGLTYAEAAELLDVPVGTVMSRLSRGRTRLRKSLRSRRPRSRRAARDRPGATTEGAGHRPGHDQEEKR
ncbi:MAG: sigma-70 family RNA polymerase sigma factor [Nocardioides sp.]|uniref:RNA polymerase sigma factor n=1 Tax=Nocardioides sp. TaxID=35761 RepID=UPI002398D163|nr:sigma-70 family RNA polymerase sigma factor [Nocardioides sp.]MDE0775540.1 sigma-70 family RNA polymerase sigma factor [Nocardioides sp.]